MAAIEYELYVFGGVNSKGSLKKMVRYNTVRNIWFEFPTIGGSFAAREGAGLVVVEGKLWLLLFGFNTRVLDHVQCYDPAAVTCTQKQTSGEKPCPRSGLRVVFLGKTYCFLEVRLGGKLVAMVKCSVVIFVG